MRTSVESQVILIIKIQDNGNSMSYHIAQCTINETADNINSKSLYVD